MEDPGEAAAHEPSRPGSHGGRGRGRGRGEGRRMGGMLVDDSVEISDRRAGQHP